MMRPLFIVSDLEMGGAQRVVLTVIRHLRRSGFQPALALVSENGPLSSELPEDIPIHKLGAGRVRYAFLKILNLCRALKPDAVISTVGHLNLLLLSLKYFLPRHTAVIVREANTPSIRLQHTRHPHLYRAAYRGLYPLCDRLICNCSYMKEDMSSHFGFPPARISVIPNPVDMEKISGELRSAESPYPGKDIQIASVGRLDHQKGFDLLLKAFQKSREKIRNMRLTIVGDGPQRKALEKHAAELAVLDAVVFAGQKKNPFPYMAHADFVVSSSRWEGSPNTVLESLACGTPVLAFDCPGGTAEIIDNEKNGWLIPAGNWQRMGDKITQVVIEKSWQAMKGGSLLPEKHLCENVVCQWEEVLRTASRKDAKGS
jgi:glycosyltransferase involved in cell wall biosynthesis